MFMEGLYMPGFLCIIFILQMAKLKVNDVR